MRKQVPRPNVLIVDDRPENLLALNATLEDIDVNVVQALSGQEALGSLLEYDFALVLLDVQMPDMDGFEVANIMHESAVTKNIPIIFLTAFSKDDPFVHKGYNAGAVDYISKPFDAAILRYKVNIFLQLWTQTHELELLNQKYQTALAEITTQRDELKEMAIKDYLTNLYQRRVFDHLLENEIKQSARYNSILSVAMLDLDFFKQVNDTYGHTVGDQVLVASAKLFLTVVRSSDVVCRFGGEEFIILMSNTNLKNATLTCERIRTGIEEMVFDNEKGKFKTTISIGVAQFQLNKFKTPAQLIKKADECLYKAKNNGRNQVFPLAVEEIL